MSKKNEVLKIRIPDHLLQDLKDKARETKTTLSSLVRMYLCDGMEKEEA